MRANFEHNKIFKEQESELLKDFKRRTEIMKTAKMWSPFSIEPMTTENDFRSRTGIDEVVEKFFRILSQAKELRDERIYHYAAIKICEDLIAQIASDVSPSYYVQIGSKKVFNERYAYLLNEFYTKFPGLALLSCPLHISSCCFINSTSLRFTAVSFIRHEPELPYSRIRHKFCSYGYSSNEHCFIRNC
jgi:hypothetical protein